MKVKIVGGGLAGAEAAYALLCRGASVDMYEMRPAKMTPAHTTGSLAELVCSNSLKSELADSASGVLKAEMAMFGSVVLDSANVARVPAGGALGVDRQKFSAEVEKRLRAFDGFNLIREEVCTLDTCGYDALIVATGPLTSDKMSKAIAEFTGENHLNFFDAEAPIVSADSIDYGSAYFAARYGKGEADYLNAPLTRQEYDAFYDALITAETAKQEVGGNYFEGCQPVEIIAATGRDSLRFGPLRPVGLDNPVTGEKYYAVLQLRKENLAGDAYNLVGFQTSLTFPMQRKVFGMIPALKNAEYLRYGVMHRNTFINSPKVLNADFSFRKAPNVYVAGQLSGVEGYMESAMSGMIAGLAAFCKAKGQALPKLPQTTIMGALSAYVSNEAITDFQPMNSNFGVLPPVSGRIRDKKLRKAAYAERAISDMKKYTTDNNFGIGE